MNEVNFQNKIILKISYKDNLKTTIFLEIYLIWYMTYALFTTLTESIFVIVCFWKLKIDHDQFQNQFGNVTSENDRVMVSTCREEWKTTEISCGYYLHLLRNWPYITKYRPYYFSPRNSPLHNRTNSREKKRVILVS